MSVFKNSREREGIRISLQKSIETRLDFFLTWFTWDRIVNKLFIHLDWTIDEGIYRARKNIEVCSFKGLNNPSIEEAILR